MNETLSTILGCTWFITMVISSLFLTKIAHHVYPPATFVGVLRFWKDRRMLIHNYKIANLSDEILIRLVSRYLLFSRISLASIILFLIGAFINGWHAA